MKGVLILLDGLGDLPNKQLKGKTPLEAALTPNMDFFATRGKLGSLYTVALGFVPESDEAIVSLFGNDLINSSRGQLEAIGAGVSMKRGDLAFRVNFATIDNLDSGNILDRRAGRNLTTKEAVKLSVDLDNIKLSNNVVFTFTAINQHRASLVFRGGFSDAVSCNGTTYKSGKGVDVTKVAFCKNIDEQENSIYTSKIVNEFLVKAHEMLENHPINLARIKKGLLPANFLLLRGAGIEPPKLKKYKNWATMVYMPLEIGFAVQSGMEIFTFEYPKLKDIDAYENLMDGLKKACKYSIKTIKKTQDKFDYLYIHLKETDLPGHDNKPLVKKMMIEYIDKTLIKFLRKFAPQRGIKIAITGDHSTPCILKAHSSDPVPLLLYDDSNLKEKHFNEISARKGELGRIVGKEFLDKIGFLK